MPIWLVQLLPVIWKFLRHFGIYLLLAVVLIGGPYLLYRHGYNEGYKAKVCPPTYTVGAGGQVINHYNQDEYKWIGVKVKCLFLKLDVGY